MKKFLICCMLTCLSGLSFGQKLDNLDTEKERNFPQTKALLEKSIAEREQILIQEKICVKQSLNKEDLKTCLKKAHQNRKEMSENLKSSIKTKP